MPLFLALMALASAISLLRGFAVAGLLDAASFGIYATVFAAGTFGSLLVSGGRVELTQKTYPRLWSDGQHAALLGSVDRGARVLVLRAGLLASLIAAVAMIAGRSDLLAPALAAAVVSWSTASVSIYASAQRASRELRSMGMVTLQRSLAAVVLGCVGAWLGSWPGAIGGEVVGSLVGVGLSRRWVVRLARPGSGSEPGPPTAAAQAGKRWLFAAALSGAVPFYLDRLFVAHRWGAEAVGRYGFLMLFVTGANVVASIVVQKVGPQLVHMSHTGSPLRAQAALATRWIGACLALYLAGMALAGFLLLKLDVGGFATKFALDAPLMAIASVLCCLQLGLILDWLLISHDRERDMYIATNVYLAAAVVAAVLATWLDWSIVELLAALALAKLGHVLALIGFSARLPRST
jgi:hypothetical protein